MRLAWRARAGTDRGIGAALSALPIDPDDLRRLYVIQAFGVGNQGELQPLALLPKVGVNVAGRTRLSSVRATPLMLAVWGGDVTLVDALLAQGANADEGGRYDFGVGSQMLTVSVSPLAPMTGEHSIVPGERNDEHGATASSAARIQQAAHESC